MGKKKKKKKKKKTPLLQVEGLLIRWHNQSRDDQGEAIPIGSKEKKSIR